MISLAVPAEQAAMADGVARALAGTKNKQAMLEDLGISSLMAEGGTLFDAALVAEAAGREGVIAFRHERILLAAAAVGMATRALEDAAAYAKERLVFGRPIGEYQGIAHPLARAITEVEGTRLLIWRAIAARAEGQAEAATLDTQAFWWAARACIPAIRTAMRTFGGYGVSEDSPLPEFYRTARNALLSAGDPDRALVTTQAPLSQTPPVPVSFTQHEAARLWQERTRAFLRDNFTPEHKRAFAESADNHFPDLHQKLASAGLLFPHWPEEWGGSGVDAFTTSAIRQTLSRAGWPISVLVVSDTIGSLLMRFGTEEAKAEILPRLARGEAIGCLGMSETGGGSDVFGAKTKAEHDGQQWIINGQKVFTTSAHAADYVLLLTRTPGGLTLFVAPLGEGFSLSPVETLAGERTNITYYADFTVPDRYLLGEADRGGKVLAATLTLEHNMGDYYLGAFLEVQEELPHTLADIMALPGMSDNEAAIRLALARFDAHANLLECLSIRAIWAGLAGESQRWYGPMCKLFGTESWSACCAELVERFAPHSLEGTIPALALIESEARKGIQATIYGGTSEIQSSMIAETRLGLPRSR